jgi:uncharacterized membrane protein
MEKGLRFFNQPYLYLLIILTGILLKFNGLESKFFWLDEIYTIEHTAGKSFDQIMASLPADTIVNINHYHTLLDLNQGNITIREQLIGLSRMPQFTPLHYVFLVFWHRIVGADYLDYRLFTLFFFLLTLPVMYLLGKKMFQSQIAGLMAASLYAVSPYVHIFAQEARYYIFWVFFLILLTYLLLMAIEKNRVKWWIVYVIIAIISLYASTLSVLIILGHLVYVWFWNKEFRMKFSLYLIPVVLSYLPWLIFIIENRAEIQSSISWQEVEISPWENLLGPWFGMAHIFSMTEPGFWDYVSMVFSDRIKPSMIGPLVIHSLLIVMMLYSMVYLVKKERSNIQWLLLLLVIPGVLFFYVLDFADDRWTTYAWRYHMVNYGGMILIVTYLLVKNIQAKKLLYTILYILLVGLSITSIFNMARSKCPPGFDFCDYVIKTADIISDDEKPLVISNYDYGLGFMGFLEVVVACSSDRIDFLVTSDPGPQIDEIIQNDYSTIYLFMSGSDLDFKVQKIYKNDSISSLLPRAVDLESYMADTYWEHPDADMADTIYDVLNMDLEQYTVTFIVQPKIMPEDSVIYITGNHAAIGRWDPGAVPMNKNPDGSWTLKCIIEGGWLEYKLTLGSWDSEFVDENGSTMPNQYLEVQSDTTVQIIVEGWRGSMP